MGFKLENAQECQWQWLLECHWNPSFSFNCYCKSCKLSVWFTSHVYPYISFKSDGKETQKRCVCWVMLLHYSVTTLDPCLQNCKRKLGESQTCSINYVIKEVWVASSICCLICFKHSRRGGGGAPYNYLYGEVRPERGTFFRLQVYKRVGISLLEVYERVGKSVISVRKKT